MSSTNSNKNGEHHQTSSSWEVNKGRLALMQQNLSTEPKILSKSAGRSSCCIYRAPRNLMDVNGRSYQPQIVSIGPYHHGCQRLQMIEEHKWRFLSLLLNRIQTRNLSLEDLLKAVQPLESRTRDCYSEILHIDQDQLIEILVLDGCFIIELFRKFEGLVPFEAEDPLRTMTWIFSTFLRDLIRLENQIPFFVLDCLFKLTQMPGEEESGPSLAELTLNFFNSTLERPDDVIAKHRDLQGKHILDLLRSSFIPQDQRAIGAEREGGSTMMAPPKMMRVNKGGSREMTPPKAMRVNKGGSAVKSMAMRVNESPSMVLDQTHTHPIGEEEDFPTVMAMRVKAGMAMRVNESPSMVLDQTHTHAIGEEEDFPTVMAMRVNKGGSRTMTPQKEMLVKAGMAMRVNESPSMVLDRFTHAIGEEEDFPKAGMAMRVNESPSMVLDRFTHAIGEEEDFPKAGMAMRVNESPSMVLDQTHTHAIGEEEDFPTVMAMRVNKGGSRTMTPQKAMRVKAGMAMRVNESPSMVLDQTHTHAIGEGEDVPTLMAMHVNEGGSVVLDQLLDQLCKPVIDEEGEGGPMAMSMPMRVNERPSIGLDQTHRLTIGEEEDEPTKMKRGIGGHLIYCVSKLRKAMRVNNKGWSTVMALPKMKRGIDGQFAQNTHLIHCVSKLRSAGISLKPGKEDSFLNIKYNRGVIEMPTITIDDFMSEFLLNCVAYEQCHNDPSKHMTTYALLLDCLINTYRDVEYLAEQNVIENYLGSDGEAAKFINDLAKFVAFGIHDCYLVSLFDEVNKYYNNKWHVHLESFKYTYFRTPWSFISALAALVLLVLTVLQTVYTIIG